MLTTTDIFCPSHGVVYFGVIRLRPNNAGEGLGRSDCLPVGLASGKEEASVQLAHKLHALPTSTREGDHCFSVSELLLIACGRNAAAEC